MCQKVFFSIGRPSYSCGTHEKESWPIKTKLMQTRHKSVYEVGRWVKSVLTGYFNYFAVPGNLASIKVMRTEVCKAWLKAIRRRSQKGRNFNWMRITRLVGLFIPHTRIRHPYPSQRFWLWLDVGAVCVSSARTDLYRRPDSRGKFCGLGLYGDL